MNSVVTSLLTGRPVVLDKPSSVAVVITTFNHARFLGEAIESVLNQTWPADEIIVVDDGSSDHPEAVVERYPGVKLIRQPNQGLSAARNTGLAVATSRFIAFLDADDLLLPRALDLGLAAHRSTSGAAFVYGGHRRTDGARVQFGPDHYEAIGATPFAELLRRNLIAMHASVLFDRQILLHAGGYDTALQRCEDYDIYLRLARRHAVASYAEPVALYRFHGANMSRDRGSMLQGVLQVLDRHAGGLSADEAEASRAGRITWTDYYAGMAVADALASLRRRQPRAAARSLLFALRAAPVAVANQGLAGIRRRLGHRLSNVRSASPVAVGRWHGGDFARGRPASQDFGWDRGQPVDRYYVERFLEGRRADIAGRVLEVGDDAYCRRFGGTQVEGQDILDIHPDNPRATIIGDLADPTVLPAGAFDCLVLTQTLQFVFDLPAAVRNLHQALRPGGVALVTVPGISQIDRGDWGADWCWSMTPVAANRLFGAVFGPENVTIASHGNFFAATAYLAGLAQAEIDLRKLEPVDPAYPVVVTIRAQRHA